MSKRAQFLAGDRPDDVAFFLHESAVSNLDALEEYADPADDGVVLVLPGEQGRSAFQSAAGIDPMALAQDAMQTDGEVQRDLAGGVCPAAEDDSEQSHVTQFVFAFAEEQNEDVGGLYAEGDVIHAYGVCSCGETYTEKWVVGDGDA